MMEQGSVCSVRLRRRELQGVAERAGETGGECRGRAEEKEQKVEQTRGETVLTELEAPAHTGECVRWARCHCRRIRM